MELNPYQVLGLAVDASVEVVRQRYLELVKRHPPDRDAERFAEIHRAYKMASDPLIQAEALAKRAPLEPNLNEVIEKFATKPIRLGKLPLLSLGNHE